MQKGEKVHVLIELNMEIDCAIQEDLHRFCEAHNCRSITEDKLHEVLEHGSICDAIMDGKGEIVIQHSN